MPYYRQVIGSIEFRREIYSQLPVPVGSHQLQSQEDGRASFWYKEDLDADLDSLKEDNRGSVDPLMEALG